MGGARRGVARQDREDSYYFTFLFDVSSNISTPFGSTRALPLHIRVFPHLTCIRLGEEREIVTFGGGGGLCFGVNSDTFVINYPLLTYVQPGVKVHTKAYSCLFQVGGTRRGDARQDREDRLLQSDDALGPAEGLQLVAGGHIYIR